MKQKDKDLLLKDLCARLPYRAKLETLEDQQELNMKWLSINICNYDDFAYFNLCDYSYIIRSIYLY